MPRINCSVRVDRGMVASWEELIPERAHTTSHKYVYSFTQTLRGETGVYRDVVTFMQAWNFYKQEHSMEDWLSLLYSSGLYKTGSGYAGNNTDRKSLFVRTVVDYQRSKEGRFVALMLI